MNTNTWKFRVFSIENQQFLPTNTGMEFLFNNEITNVTSFMNNNAFYVERLLGYDKTEAELYENDIVECENGSKLVLNTSDFTNFDTYTKVGNSSDICF